MLSQSHYINELIKYFEIDNCNPTKTPLPPETDLSNLFLTNIKQSKIKSVSYLSAMESLQYLVTITWPDTTYAVSYLRRCNYNPHLTHWNALKHLLCYLKETSNYKLIYKESNDLMMFQTYSNTLYSSYKQSHHFTDRYATIVYDGAAEQSLKH